MLRTIIIDDELAGINTLKVLLDRLNINVTGSSFEEEHGIKLVNKIKPDLLFLDINMPNLTGFEFLEKVSFKDFQVVFTTAHQEFALKAIKNSAFDYLLKPIDFEDLKLCIDKYFRLASKKENQPSRGLLELSVADGIEYIKQQNILHVEANGSYSIIYMNNGQRYVASKNLKHIELLLKPEMFFRCHQSHVVNIKEIEKIITANGNFVKLSNGKLVDVSKNQKAILLSLLKKI